MQGEWLERHGLDRPAILVVALHPEGPATRAGLQTYDVLTAADGDPISDPYGWLASFNERPPGSTVGLEVLRDGAILQVELTLETPPEDEPS